MNSRYHYFEALKTSSLVKTLTKVITGDIVARIIGLGTTIIIIRGLTVSDYAAYTAFMTILLFFPGLIGNGINFAVVRYAAEHISKTGKKPFELYTVSFIFQLIVYCIIGIAVFLMSDTVSKLFFGEKDFKSAFQYGYMAGFGYLIVQAGRVIYQAEERFSLYVRTQWFRQLLVLSFILILFIVQSINFSRVAYTIICADMIVAGMITFHIFHRVGGAPIRSLFAGQKQAVRELIISTGWLMSYFFVLNCFLRLDVFMLSHMSSGSELANYGVAYRYYSILLMMLPSIQAVLLPRFSRMEMQDHARQSQFIFKWLKATVWLIIPILLFDFFGKPFYVWINGVEYANSFSIFLIFSVGVWVSLMLSPLVNVLIARKEFKFLFITGSAAFILNFASNYLFIPMWGGRGAALATVFTHNIIIQGLIVAKLGLFKDFLKHFKGRDK